MHERLFPGLSVLAQIPLEEVDCKKLPFEEKQVEMEELFQEKYYENTSYKVVQCRGYHNNPTKEDSEVRKFVEGWLNKAIYPKVKDKVA